MCRALHEAYLSICMELCLRPTLQSVGPATIAEAIGLPQRAVAESAARYVRVSLVFILQRSTRTFRSLSWLCLMPGLGTYWRHTPLPLPPR